MTALLESVGLTYAYHRRADPVLHGVSIAVQPGESVGLVGESGAGKTTILRLLLGLDTPTDGEIRFDGRPLDLRDRAGMRAFRRAVQPVYQDPFSSLDPRMPIGASIAEPLRSLGLEPSPQARREIVAGLLRDVDLPADAAERHPEAFSGGQRQRIAIARALAPSPRLILADEPVSALDTSVRMTVIELFRRLAAERGIGVLLVSHDLTIVSALTSRTVVLQHGRVVESGDTQRLLTAPEQPYTRSLLAAVPRLPR